MGVPHSATFTSLSPLGEACSRKDLTAIHEVLENLGYKDDEGVANEVLLSLFYFKQLLDRPFFFPKFKIFN